MKTTLSIRSANILFLISILLVLTLGSLMQVFSLSWGLIGTEVLCIALPTILALRLQHIPLRQGLRLRMPSLGVVLLCLLLGVGGWLVAGFIDVFIMQLTGQPAVDLTGVNLPTSTLDYLIYGLALAVFAPLGEEILFRGAIQGAYENHKTPAVALTISSLMFAFYHFRLTGLPALLPLAFLLGYVVWRTQSLFSGMLLHFANNLLAAGFGMVASLIPNIQVIVPSVWSALVGLLILIPGLWALRRITIAPRLAAPAVPAESVPSEAPVAVVPLKQPGWFAVYWSLIVAGLLYLAVAGLTLMVALNPKMTAQKGVTFQPGRLDHTVSYEYRVVNRAGDNVGSVNCTVQPVDQFLDLDCARQVRGYEIKVGNSQWIDNGNTAHWTARWDAQTMGLIAFTYDIEFENGSVYHSTMTPNSLVTSVDGTTLKTDRPNDLLVEHEWPWRAANLDLTVGANRMVDYGRLLQWDNVTNSSQPVVTPELLRVQSGGNLTVPAGEFPTFKVMIGDKSTAWYSTGRSSLLVRYDDGINFYELVSAAP